MRLLPSLWLLAACADKSAPPTESCADGEVQDGDACVPEACGTGTWGDLASLSPTIYVDGAAEAGGDGSEEAPLSTISDALLAEADAGAGVIAVAAGTYPETLVLKHRQDGVVLAGRCAALVTLDAGGAPVGVEADDGLGENSAAISGLTVQGATVAGVYLASGAYTLHDLVLQDNAGRGLEIDGPAASATVVDLTVARTALGEDGAAYGVGLTAGAILNGADLNIEDSGRNGLIASASSVSVTGLSVSGTSAEGGADLAGGLWLEEGSSAEISDAQFSDNATTAIKMESDATLDLSDAQIEGQLSPGPDEAWCGVAVDQSSASLTRVTISNVQPCGIRATSDAQVSLDQVTVTDVAGAGSSPGAAVSVVGGSTVEGTDLIVARSESTGIWVKGGDVDLDRVTISDVTLAGALTSAVGVAVDRGTATISNLDVSAVEGEGVVEDLASEVALTHCVIHDLPAGPQVGAGGMVVERGSALSASDCTLSDVTGIGLLLVEGSSADLDGVSITHIDRYDGNLPGSGLITCEPARPGETPTSCTLVAHNLLVSDAIGCGIQITETDATLTQTAVTGMRPQADGAYGYGIEVDVGGTVVAQDVEVSDVYGLGLGAFQGGSVRATDLAIREVHNAPESQVGSGLAAYEGGQLMSSNAVIEDTDGPGIDADSDVADHSRLTCTSCAVRRATFAGAMVLGEATLTLDGGTTVEDTAVNAGLGGGVGILAAEDRDLATAPTLLLDGITVTGSPLTGLYIAGSGTVSVRDSVLEGGQDTSGPEIQPWGDAVFTTASPGDAQFVLLYGDTLEDAAGAGLFLDGTTATLGGNLWENNALDLLQQRCDETVAPVGEDASDLWERCPTYDLRVEPLVYYVYEAPFVLEGG